MRASSVSKKEIDLLLEELVTSTVRIVIDPKSLTFESQLSDIFLFKVVSFCVFYVIF